MPEFHFDAGLLNIGFRPAARWQMTPDQVMRGIPGGPDLIEWFGTMPQFHDAKLLSIDLASQNSSKLRIHAWRMTNEVDADGYYKLDKHAVVTLVLSEVTRIELEDFDQAGIILDLQITAVDGGYQVEWERSCGVQGMLRARRMCIELQPGEP